MGRAAWSAAIETQLERHVRALCDAAEPPPARDAAWRALVIELAPHLEEWASRSRLLRRCGLASEDDTRNVLVDVLERLAANQHEALRRYLERRPAAPAPAEHALVDSLARWGRLGEIDDDAPAEPVPLGGSDTPLRAWLLSQLEWAIKDYVRHRYGWSARATGSEPAPSKRDVNTNADRLATGEGPSARPPLTDWITLQRLLEEIEGFAAGFPAPMKRALDLWLVDHGFEEIAARVPVASADEARALVRAAQARLRERFRERWPL